MDLNPFFEGIGGVIGAFIAVFLAPLFVLLAPFFAARLAEICALGC